MNKWNKYRKPISVFHDHDYSLWQQRNSPHILNENTIKLANELTTVYDFNCFGGHLKPMLFNWRLDDHTIKYYLHIVLPDSIKYTERRQISFEKRCLETMLTMTEEERYAALAIVNGFIYTKYKTSIHKYVLN